MSADDFNSRHPVGTPVFAYPGARPEDYPQATRLVTKTRSRASVLGGHTDVVWVDGHSACIALTHVDVVTGAEYEAALPEDAVAELGALPMPVPVGPEPQVDAVAAGRRLDLLALMDERAASVVSPCLAAVLDEAERLRARLAELERTVQQMVDGLNGHDCPPPGESPMGAVTRFAVRLMEAERLLAEDGCSCPPVDRTHQIGCPLDGVPAPGPCERPVNGLTAVFVPVASLREPEPEFYGLVHHDYRVSHDLPETGGAR